MGYLLKNGEIYTESYFLREAEILTLATAPIEIYNPSYVYPWCFVLTGAYIVSATITQQYSGFNSITLYGGNSGENVAHYDNSLGFGLDKFHVTSFLVNWQANNKYGTDYLISDSIGIKMDTDPSGGNGDAIIYLKGYRFYPN
jgi:hypothetical protein